MRNNYYNKPNIILIILDTVRADHLSCYGYHKNTTPNIDLIAKEGVLYLNTISQSPWTLPSHASIFTGTYLSKHRTDIDNKKLNPKLMTITEYLSNKADYKCYGISNNVWVSREFNFNRGFHQFYHLWEMFQKKGDNFLIDKLKRFLNSIYIKFYSRKYRFRMRRNIRYLMKSIKDINKEALFIFMNLMEAHLPLKPPLKNAMRFIENGYNRRRIKKVNQEPFKYISNPSSMSDEDFYILKSLYDAEINYMDDMLGRFFQELRRKGIIDNFMIIITSDHGENFGEHNLMSHQYCLYDTLIRVPLIIRYPDKFKGGSIIRDCVETIDIFPTIVDVIGGIKDIKQFQGISLLDKKSINDRKYVFSEYIVPFPHLNKLKKYNKDFDTSIFDRSLRCLRSNSIKYIWSSNNRDELYFLNSDPDELINEIYNYNDRDVLKKEIVEWVERVKEKEVVEEDHEFEEEIKKHLEHLGYI